MPKPAKHCTVCTTEFDRPYASICDACSVKLGMPARNSPEDNRQRLRAQAARGRAHLAEYRKRIQTAQPYPAASGRFDDRPSAQPNTPTPGAIQ